MPELTFYRQARHDGGIRTGIEGDGENTLLIEFLEGSPEHQDDPLGAALLWYVDLRCRGENLPIEPDDVKGWFLRQRNVFQEGLQRFADLISAGKDDSFPLRWSEFHGVPDGVQIELVCSAIRRITGHELANILREIGLNFEDYLLRLAPPEPALR
ncbi:MAG: hypothetical protein ABI353_18855 [Isosphaeraceae bacterium]